MATFAADGESFLPRRRNMPSALDADTLVLLFLSVGAASIPLLAYLALLVWLDRYEREPIWLVSLVFLWGAVGAIVLGVIGSIFLGLPTSALLGASLAEAVGTAVIAPVAEEPAKALVLFLLVLSRHFDNPTDGFVYGAAAGLGFGMTENLLYFAVGATGASTEEWVVTVVLRTLFTAPMHACATAMVGMAFGFAKFKSWRYRTLVVPIGFLLAIGLHMMWNGLLVLDDRLGAQGALALIDYLLMMAVFVMIFIAYQVSLWSEARLIRRELLAECRIGTLPRAHVQHLSSWRSRAFGRSWVPRSVSIRDYIETATLLAFRRDQAQCRPDDPFYREDVLRLRERLKLVLSGAQPPRAPRAPRRPPRAPGPPRRPPEPLS